MRVPTFLKGAVAGGVGATVVMGASVALAGSGIGGVFNLGQSNTVDETTSLSGTKAGPQLQVTNSSTGSGATGLGVNVPVGKPPFAINSTTMVPNLNADQVDNYHASQLTRIGQAKGYDQVTVDSTSSSDIAIVTVKAPMSGYVYAHGEASAHAGAAVETVSLSIIPDTGAPTPSQIADVGDAYAPIGVSYVIPVVPGTHTYALHATSCCSNTPASFRNARIIAEFKPFNWQGTKTGALHP